MHESVAICAANVLLFPIAIRLLASTSENVICGVWNVLLKFELSQAPRIYFVIGWFNIELFLYIEFRSIQSYLAIVFYDNIEPFKSCIRKQIFIWQH